MAWTRRQNQGSWRRHPRIGHGKMPLRLSKMFWAFRRGLARNAANFFYRGRMVPCVQGRFFHFLVCPSAQGFSPFVAQICLRECDVFSGVDRRLFYLGHAQPTSLRNPKTIGKSLGKPFFATERGSPVQGKKAVVFFGVFCGVSEQVFEGPARKTGVAD